MVAVDDALPLRSVNDLLHELVRADAKQATLLNEGYTPREIRDARKHVAVASALDRKQPAVACRTTHDTGNP